MSEKYESILIVGPPLSGKGTIRGILDAIPDYVRVQMQMVT
ncbi:MAG: hypothetical protein ABIE94_03095 [archaeon]